MHFKRMKTHGITTQIARASVYDQRIHGIPIGLGDVKYKEYSSDTNGTHLSY